MLLPLPPMTIAPAGGVDLRRHPARHARHGHVAVVGQLLELCSNFGSVIGTSAFAGVDHGAAVHLLHQVAEAAAGAAVVERVAHVVLAHHDRIKVRRQFLDFALAQRRQCGGVGGLRRRSTPA